jgi:hypothetical protein
MTTEQQVLALALRLGPWAGLILAIAYIIANKLGPTWLEEWRAQRRQIRETEEAERKARVEEEKEDRKTIMTFYERLVTQESKMIEFIGAATESQHALARSLDDNTRQLYHLTQTVERGPRCPLPNCPYIKNPAGSPAAGS